VETVGDVSCAEVVWEGKIDVPFIGDASQDWDKCLLVRYPSRQHFLAMMADAEYRESLIHRYAASSAPSSCRCGADNSARWVVTVGHILSVAKGRYPASALQREPATAGSGRS
jgi:hypothetical protein